MLKKARDNILMIYPQSPKSATPVIDSLTRKMTAAYRYSTDGIAYRGWHTCVCGARSDSTDHWIGDVLTNSLCMHYLAYHRQDIPSVELQKVDALQFGEREPTERELQCP